MGCCRENRDGRKFSVCHAANLFNDLLELSQSHTHPVDIRVHVGWLHGVREQEGTEWGDYLTSVLERSPFPSLWPIQSSSWIEEFTWS
jgi:tryptophan 2,3-dioxygenase